MVDQQTITLPSPLDRLSQRDLRIQNADVGSSLFHQGSTARGLFVLISGEVRLQRTSEDGHQILIHRVLAGSTFAEGSLFTETYHCHASVTRKSVLVECSRTAILQAYRNDPDFALTMSALFASQMQAARKRMELLSIRGADERVFSAVAAGLLVGDVKSFATDIALSPEAVYRSLSKLAKSGKISKNGYGRYGVQASTLS